MPTPIIIFAFNRPEAFRTTVEALAANPEAKESLLYVFIDGPRPDKEGEAGKVRLCRDYAASITGFKKVEISASTVNRGMGPSIIEGVTKVIEMHGSAIVLEDDLVVLPNFLAFMNQGLETYRDAPEVWSVCGYTNKVKIPADYPYDAYFAPRSSSWGWATWKDRWESVDWSFGNWSQWAGRKREFNRWGGSDCFSMLDGCRRGLNKSWAIRFCFSQFLQDKLSLFPVKSLVKNDGFDGNGTNCRRYSRFKYILADPHARKFRLPDKVEAIPSIVRSAIAYHSIPRRLWSKLMYTIKR